MEEFDLENMDFGGTNISALKSDSDNEFKQIIDNLSQSDNSLQMRPKRQMNMNHFVKSVERDIERFGSEPVNMSGPLPSNMDSKNDVIPTRVFPQGERNTKPIVKKQEVKSNNDWKIMSLLGPKIKEYLVFGLVFMILNNSFIITFIYDRIPFMKTFESPYPNLLLRTILFVTAIYFIKKYYTDK
jgi:hypothetical protein